MPDPDLEMGGGGGHLVSSIKGRAGLLKTIFRPFGPQFGPKIRGGPGPPGPSPGSATGLYSHRTWCARNRSKFLKKNEWNTESKDGY